LFFKVLALELTLYPWAGKLMLTFKHEARAPKLFMAEGYCVKCKAKKEISNGVEETMKNGRKAIKGKCPTCGTVMFKILGKAAAMAPTNPNPPSA
jgi:hypothetical protein